MIERFLNNVTIIWSKFDPCFSIAKSTNTLKILIEIGTNVVTPSLLERFKLNKQLTSQELLGTICLKTAYFQKSDIFFGFLGQITFFILTQHING